MKTLAIDAGNSKIKMALFEKGILLRSWIANDLDTLNDVLQFEDYSKLIVSSVSIDPDLIIDHLRNNVPKLILDVSTPLPIFNHYSTQGTLGKDRIAALCGAKYLFPNKPLLVIDAGTCITYDHIDSEGNFYGGIISLGLRMRFKALHHFTSRLPLIDAFSNEPSLIGSSTQSAMESGVINGMKAEVAGIVERYSREKGHFDVIICGGDREFFESSIKQPIFAVPELVLIGLNAILEHNEV